MGICKEICTFGLENSIEDEFFLTTYTSIPAHKAQSHHHGDLGCSICIPLHHHL